MSGREIGRSGWTTLEFFSFQFVKYDSYALLIYFSLITHLRFVMGWVQYSKVNRLNKLFI